LLLWPINFLAGCGIFRWVWDGLSATNGLGTKTLFRNTEIQPVLVGPSRPFLRLDRTDGTRSLYLVLGDNGHVTLMNVDWRRIKTVIQRVFSRHFALFISQSLPLAELQLRCVPLPTYHHTLCTIKQGMHKYLVCYHIVLSALTV
jgi:hypothetical protein